tara:strand:- start:263 stop:367 length:105 start_codon:yes stop_codon:yes gene_type:complete
MLEGLLIPHLLLKCLLLLQQGRTLGPCERREDLL